MPRDIAKADLIILDEFGYVPFDIDGAGCSYQVIAGSYERRSIILRREHRVQANGARFLPMTNRHALVNRPHRTCHGRLIEFTGQAHRISQTLMFGKPQNQ